MGCKLIACDPNFVFRMKDGTHSNVPLAFVMELSNIFSVKWTDMTEEKYGKRK
jgi:hypothetical protein